MIVVILISLLVSSALMFSQSDYDFDFERVELGSYNEDLTSFKVLTYKYNRTQPAVNMSLIFKIDLGNNAMGVVQTYTFLSNEYREFPLRYSFNICEAIAKNDYGLSGLLDKGNFTGCPIRKGSYFIFNWKPDPSRFPPYIPNGHYMSECQLMHFAVELGMMRGYGTVSRPLGRRH